MSMKKKSNTLLAVRVAALLAICVVSIAPFYVAVCYAFKSKTDFARTKLAFPTHFYLENFTEAVGLSNYFNSFKNSVIVSIFMVLIIVTISSTGAYIIARKNNKFYNAVYYLFQLIILIPFQTVMFPLYRQLYGIQALNTLWGLVLAQAGVFVGYNVFLYTGFIKGIPVSLEEAAQIDGCNRYQTFFHIVFPLLKPINMTVVVLSFLSSWNDFIISMIICQKQEKRTLPLMQYFFFGEYSSNISVAFAASLLAMIPTVLIYFLAQKYIVAGMTAGAVKS
ncbi:L-arabinose transport system permease protein AraQ [Blautia producta]|uniref:L-arabinose transport system permease protein AraQ n=1 Tax=Blautia producta TaxID=33035 RepID=A0A4P6M2T9_9FIRM|nr:carbohydrate ABC transporter permease [Blautia producta]QBE97763.1 L-arabinose transport system permease protein AraQ [Blautia producta]